MPAAWLPPLHPFRSVIKTHVLEGGPSVHNINARIRRLEGAQYPWPQRQRQTPPEQRQL